MSAATAQDFKGKQSSKKTVIGSVPVPAFNKEVWICKPSAGARGLIQRALLKDGEAKFYNARLVIAVSCDEQGNLLFTEADEAWLSELDYDVLEPIIEKTNLAKKPVTEKNSDGGSATA